MSKKKEIDVLKEIQALAKKLGGVHPYDEKIKIDEQNRAIWTNGFILIRAQIGATYPPGLYNAKDMSPINNDHYPKTDGFFEDYRIRENYPKILEAAGKIKPYGTKETIGINKDGRYSVDGSLSGCINLATANLAVSLGLDICLLDKHSIEDTGIYKLTNKTSSIILVTPSLDDRSR